jgi:hypothetical protein
MKRNTKLYFISSIFFKFESLSNTNLGGSSLSSNCFDIVKNTIHLDDLNIYRAKFLFSIVFNTDQPYPPFELSNSPGTPIQMV